MENLVEVVETLKTLGFQMKMSFVCGWVCAYGDVCKMPKIIMNKCASFLKVLERETGRDKTELEGTGGAAVKRVLAWLKKEIVLTIAWALVGVTAFLVPPDMGYLDYIDFHTLGLLFCLMAVMAGLQRLGLFRKLGEGLLRKAKSARQVEVILVFLCFVSSCILTNDVALITFVPFAITVLGLSGMGDRLVSVVVMQTIAANLGSMLTPIGNPQNLYLYGQSGLPLGRFVAVTAPYAMLSAVLLAVWLLCRKSAPIALSGDGAEAVPLNRKQAVLYGVLFLVSLGAVARIVSVWLAVGVVLAVVLLTDRETLKHVDYALLLTFVGFFVFVGNMGRLTFFADLLQRLVEGREVVCAVVVSQCISNVPAALLLSGFTENWEGLIVGTNLGGLGTLIASMASLISYKALSSHLPGKKGAYMGVFTLANVAFLGALLLLVWIL